MKLKQLLFNTYKQEAKHTEDIDLLYLEEKILTEIRMRYPKKQTAFSHVTIALGFSFLCLLVVLNYPYISNTFTSHISTPLFITPVQAEVTEISKKLDQPLAYTIETKTNCSLWNFDEQLKDESGLPEQNLSVLKQKADCDKNNGTFTSHTTYFIDPQKNAVRKEDHISEWLIPPSLPDKNGDLRNSSIEPVQIQIHDDQYSFVAAAVQTNDGTYEGVYVQTATNNKTAQRNQTLAKLPTIHTVLEMYKQAPNNTTALTEQQEGDRTYVILKQIQNDVVMREDWFDKETKIPYRSKEYLTNGTVTSETKYTNSNHTVTSDAFDLTKAPKGYKFISGQLQSVQVRLVECKTCKYGDSMYYDIAPKTYLNTDGMEVSVPTIDYQAVVNPPFSISVAEVINPDTTTQLSLATSAEVSSIDSFVFGTVYTSNYSIGEIAQTKLTIQTRNSLNEQPKIFTQTVPVPYTTNHFDSYGQLEFRFERHYHQGIPEIIYRSTKHENVLIAIQRNGFQDLCRGYREPTVCSQIVEGSYNVSVVKNPLWWRSDVLYKDFFATIQFSEPDILDDTAKQGIINDVKKLLTILDQ